MEPQLSFWNWSIKKLLDSESDSFLNAKIKILYTVLLLSILKVVIVIYFSWFYYQNLQLGRGLVLILIYTILLKLLLIHVIKLKLVTHIMLTVGLVLVVTNILYFSSTVNIITLQFVFMVTLSSFYLLGTRYGIIYSLIAFTPIVIYMLCGGEMIYFPKNDGTLVSPAFEIIVILNFLTIIFSHYLFQQAFLSNVKEKEQLNDQLLIAVEKANQAAQSKSDFLSTMSHELRTPLNSVIGMTDLFLDNPQGIDREENLKILKFSAVSLNAVINDILDFNKLGSEKLKLEAINLNLNDLVQDICSGLDFRAKEKGIDLFLNIDDEIKHINILSDSIRITQILFNLIGNAIKFTSEGNVTVSLTTINKTDTEIEIQFAIADTGIGISENQKEQIFEPFSQASTSTTRNYGGTGLGLPIVKRLLLLFRSQIYLESEADKGSRFHFQIGFKIGEKVQNVDANQDNNFFDLSSLIILVAEDNMMNRLLLKKVLSKWNNEPVFAENGQEAVDLAKAQYFDVILMDLHMPIMDGYNAAKSIRQLDDLQKSQIPIIAFTASVSHNLQEKIMAFGMNDYIYKPFNPKDLYNKLNAIVQLNNKKI